MTQEDDKIKDLFGSKFKDFEPEVSASVWSRLDQSLSQQTSIKKNKVGIARKAILTATAIAASLAVGVFVFYNSQQIEIPTILVEQQQLKEEIPVAPKESGEVIEKDETIILAETEPAFVALASTVHPPEESIVAEASAVSSDLPKVEEGPKFEKKETPEQEEVFNSPTVLKKAEISLIDRTEDLPVLEKQDPKKKMSVSLKSNTGGLSSNVNERGGGMLFSRQERSRDLASLLRAENKDYELRHRQPVSVGLTVSKNLSKRFSLETGLMFTHLSSRVKSNSMVNLKEEQEFGYLGVPIYLNYRFYELAKVDFYLSLGILTQKDIYGKYTSKLKTDNINMADVGLSNYSTAYTVSREPTYMKHNISQKHWQFSSHLTVGASYPIYKVLRIYTALGGAYYFDANNEYRTIYSDKKFQLDLNLGLRVEF